MKFKIFNKKSILITGGTGSFGQKFVETLIKKSKPKKIIVFSRDELKQFDMQKKFANYENLRFFLGDIRDVNRLTTSMEDVDYVVHAAALKQVPLLEYNPFEAIKTNILGAQNIIDAALKNKVKKVIALSTDKATAPINLYGATKLAADKLFISANNYVGKKSIKFSVVRYGNVAGSRGSVIPYFIEQAKKGFITITDRRMTRFNISLDEGVNFVVNSLNDMKGGETYVPKIPSYRILDLAKSIDSKAKIKFIGIRAGEKIHEEMITRSDSLNTIEFKEYFVILPPNNKNFKKLYPKLSKKEFSYSSENNKRFMNNKELKKLINKFKY